MTRPAFNLNANLFFKGTANVYRTIKAKVLTREIETCVLLNIIEAAY